LQTFVVPSHAFAKPCVLLPPPPLPLLLLLLLLLLSLTDQWDSLEPLAAPSLKSRLPSHGPTGHKKRVREDQRTGPLAASVLSQVCAAV
jgi:hypothetical protein